MLIWFQFSLLLQTLMGLQPFIRPVTIYPTLCVNHLYSHPLCISTSLSMVKTKPFWNHTSQACLHLPNDHCQQNEPLVIQTYDLRHPWPLFVFNHSYIFLFESNAFRGTPFPHCRQRACHPCPCVSLSWLPPRALFSFTQEMNTTNFPS